MRALIVIAALLAAGPVLAAAEAPAQTNKPEKPAALPAPLLNQPFGKVFINRGFTDKHYRLPRKVDIKKQQPKTQPAVEPGKVMRGA